MMTCVCVCVITKASGESEAIWGKKKFIFSKLAESQLHVFVLTLVCRDLETKNPPDCLEVLNNVCRIR